MASAEISDCKESIAICREQFQTIKLLENEGGRDQELQDLKKDFEMILAIDYQQGKLLPHWGRDKQAGETYFLRKLNYTVLGIINHGTYPLQTKDTNVTPELSRVYVEEEQNGSKNADHLCSSIQKYMEELNQDWISNYVIYLDNAATNKNNTVCQWTYEYRKMRGWKKIEIRFLVPGHTKYLAGQVVQQNRQYVQVF